MTARSYEEAQEQRCAEVLEEEYDRIAQAYYEVAQIVSQPGGERFLPLFNRLKVDFEGLQKQAALIDEARAVAARQPPPKVRKRSSKARRAFP